MLALLLLSMTPDAAAGAVGVISHTGYHQGKAYYYRSDGEQGVDSQYRPHLGSGIELMLGDKDDRLQGLLRMYWNRDMPLQNPSYLEEEGYTYEHPNYDELTPRDDGVISIGLQWGIWGEPTAFQVIGTTSLASGFWTVDNLEYFVLDAGVGAMQTLNDQLQFYGTVNFSPRYRKQLLVSSNAFVGARFLFD